MKNNNAGLVRLTSRKDKHLARRMFHIIPGLVGVSLYAFEVFSVPTITYFCLIGAGLLFVFDFYRLQNSKFNHFVCRFARSIMRDDEKEEISGLPFYLLGVGLACLFFSESVALLAVLFLILGDPTAAFIGTVYGREHFLPRKSLEGSLACFLICYGMSFFYLKALGVLGLDAVLFSLIAGAIGCFSELISSQKLDDNLTIPLISGVGITLLNSALPLL